MRLPNYNPEEHTPKLEDALMTRRDMLRKTGMGMGALSLAMLLKEGLVPSQVRGAIASGAITATSGPLAPKMPHFAGKAKHVIHIFAGGGPSHVDTWDP